MQKSEFYQDARRDHRELELLLLGLEREANVEVDDRRRVLDAGRTHCEETQSRTGGHALSLLLPRTRRLYLPAAGFASPGEGSTIVTNWSTPSIFASEDEPSGHRTWIDPTCVEPPSPIRRRESHCDR